MLKIHNWTFSRLLLKHKHYRNININIRVGNTHHTLSIRKEHFSIFLLNLNTKLTPHCLTPSINYQMILIDVLQWVSLRILLKCFKTIAIFCVSKEIWLILRHFKIFDYLGLITQCQNSYFFEKKINISRISWLTWSISSKNFCFLKTLQNVKKISELINICRIL